MTTRWPSQHSPGGVTFDVAIDCEADSLAYPEAPIWLEVEIVDASLPAPAVPEAEQRDAGTNDAWTGVMKKISRHYQPEAAWQVEKLHKKLVKRAAQLPSTNASEGQRIAVSCSTTVTVVQASASEPDESGESVPIITAVVSDALVDLETIDDFCQHFQIPQTLFTNKCVGYIKDVGLYRFYVSPPERRLSRSPKSLAEIIAWTAADELSRTLPRTAMAQFASSLAAAVLQYCPTPWLPETWQSSHVHFFGVGELSNDIARVSFATPYFRIEFTKPDKGKGRLSIPVPITAAAADGASTPAPAALARNEPLFRFGIVLLELGYG